MSTYVWPRQHKNISVKTLMALKSKYLAQQIFPRLWYIISIDYTCSFLNLKLVWIVKLKFVCIVINIFSHCLIWWKYCKEHLCKLCSCISIRNRVYNFTHELLRSLFNSVLVSIHNSVSTLCITLSVAG